MTPIHKIKTVPLFAGCTDENLQELLRLGQQSTAPKGSLLFSEGEPARGFYVLLEGKVKLYKLSGEGKEKILHIVMADSTFAEAAMFGDGSYPAFAETLKKSELIFFPRKEFLALIQRDSRMAINIIAGLSKFLRYFTTQIEELTFRDVPSRLARYLLELPQNKKAVELPITKSELASRIGTVSETLSRTLRKLSDEEIISVSGRIIEILDKGRLEALGEKDRGE